MTTSSAAVGAEKDLEVASCAERAANAKPEGAAQQQTTLANLNPEQPASSDSANDKKNAR